MLILWIKRFKWSIGRATRPSAHLNCLEQHGETRVSTTLKLSTIPDIFQLGVVSNEFYWTKKFLWHKSSCGTLQFTAYIWDC
jgi:hypothetical protein